MMLKMMMMLMIWWLKKDNDDDDEEQKNKKINKIMTYHFLPRQSRYVHFRRQISWHWEFCIFWDRMIETCVLKGD